MATDEFKAITDPKKLPSYAGVASYEYQSDISVRAGPPGGKTRVSQYTHKQLKSLFRLASMLAIRVKGELQAYY